MINNTLKKLPRTNNIIDVIGFILASTNGTKNASEKTNNWNDSSIRFKKQECQDEVEQW